MSVEQIKDDVQQSLSTKAARTLATTTKSVPQMVGKTPQWFLKLLPWVQVEAGTYRVNRRKLVIREAERIRVNVVDGHAKVEPKDLRALPLLQDVDEDLIESLAGKFVTEDYDAGQAVMTEGEQGDKFYIIARGKVEISATGRYGQKEELAVLADGDYFGEIALLTEVPRTATVETRTPCLFLTLERSQFEELLNVAPEMRAIIERVAQERRQAKDLLMDDHGEKRIEILSSHKGEADIPQTYVDYTEEPSEYSLSIVQSILRVHTRVSDIYNQPIDQLREQTRLTVQGMKERQEWEMINNPDFGLLNALAPSMRVQTRSGPPTPDDMDSLLSTVWKKPAFFLAHPKAIAAFGRECTKRGVPPPTVEMFGSPFVTWRGVPLVPTNKLLLNGESNSQQSVGTTNILLMRVGENEQGVIGLHQTGIPGEQLPSLSVRFMGINEQAVASYLVTLYFSLAVLVDDALGVLENVEVSHYYENQ